MTPELLTVLWIAAVGASLLFIALGGLVGLMYLLTAPRPFRRQGRPNTRPGTPRWRSHRPVISAGPTSDAEERDRRRRAAAVAVGLARAEAERAELSPADSPVEAPGVAPALRGPWLPGPELESPAWRLVHRTRHLGQSRVRMKSRS